MSMLAAARDEKWRPTIRPGAAAVMSRSRSVEGARAGASPAAAGLASWLRLNRRVVGRHLSVLATASMLTSTSLLSSIGDGWCMLAAAMNEKWRPFLCWQGRSRGPGCWRSLARGGEGGEGGGGAPFGETGAQHLAPCFSARPAFSFGDDARGRKWEGATLVVAVDERLLLIRLLVRLPRADLLPRTRAASPSSRHRPSSDKDVCILECAIVGRGYRFRCGVPARAPSALLLLDILAAALGRVVGRHFSFLAAASMLICR